MNPSREEMFRALLRLRAEAREMPEGPERETAVWTFREAYARLLAAGVPKEEIGKALYDEQAEYYAQREQTADRKNAKYRFAEFLRSLDWTDEASSLEKAYVLCCLSQLSYAFLGGGEREAIGRLLVVPSETLAEMAGAASSNVAAAFLQETGVGVEFFQAGGFVYGMFYAPDVILVAIRGTSEKKDWLINLRAPALLSKAPAYHTGFRKEAELGHDELFRRIRRRRCPVWVAGHSLGGAVAAIINQRNTTWGGYVFGTPRYANAAGVARREPHAFVRPSDLVPHIPPSRLGYADAASNQRVLGPPDGRGKPTGGETLSQWLEPGRRFAVQHSVEGYRRLIAHEMDPAYPDLAFAEALRDLIRTSPNVVAKI